MSGLPVPPRVVMIARQFWPQSCDADLGLHEIALGLACGGGKVTVLTPRWQPQWPEETVQRGMRIIRLPAPAASLFGKNRFGSAIGDWLTHSAGTFDVAYVQGLQHEAQAAVRASDAGRRFPVILRPLAAGLKGDVYWQLETRGGRSIKVACQRASAFVASNRAIERELIAGGFPRDKIVFIPDGVVAHQARTAQAQQQARAAIFAAQPALGESGPAAMYVGELTVHGMAELVAQWHTVVARCPGAKLWLMGTGPQRLGLAKLIDDSGLTSDVVIADRFDTLDEVFAAADVLVLPSAEVSSPYAVLQALASGLPVVGLRSPIIESIVVDGEQGILIDEPHAPGALVQAVAELFSDPKRNQQLGTAAREHAITVFPLSETLRRHQRLFGQLLADADTAAVG